METTNRKIKEKLDKCLENAFFVNSTEYKKYNIQLVDSYSNKFNGEYITSAATLIVQKDETRCKDLEFATAIHELSHHVEYVKHGYTKHDETFLKIQRTLLNAAFNLGFLNPCKLLLEEEFLSVASECNKIKQDCLNYIKIKNLKQNWDIQFTYFEEKAKKDKGYTYIPSKDCWYRFVLIK